MEDLVYGNEQYNIPSTSEKMEKGDMAIQAIRDYKEAQKQNNDSLAAAHLETFEQYYNNMGYGYFDQQEEVVPPIGITFYSFHLMPVKISTSHISTTNVQTTFWIFAALFTILLIAEVSIMVRQIKIGPK